MKHIKNKKSFPAPENAIYTGKLYHARHVPFHHSYSYKTFAFFVDIDNLHKLQRSLKLFSLNNWNITSLYNKDHGFRDHRNIREWIEKAGELKNKSFKNKKIFMLAFPRLYGYVFNPISIYFIYHYDNTIEYILYEVKNTFKEQHGYLMPVDTAPSSDEAIHQRTSKMLHVSPFIHMDCHYHFRIRSPLDDFQISIHQFDNDNKILTAYWDGKKRALNDLNIIKTVLSHPFMTYKVTAAIHWQALRLWLKGLRYIPKPKRKNEDIS